MFAGRPSLASAELSKRIAYALPFLHEATAAARSRFGSPVPDRVLYPDRSPHRGHLLPVPPPPGSRGVHRVAPLLVGVQSGRPWRVDLFVPRGRRFPIAPKLAVATSLRLEPPGTLHPGPLPWLAVAPQPTAVKSRLATQPTVNLARLVGIRAVGGTRLRTGRAMPARHRPPVPIPLVVEAWQAPLEQLLQGEEFLTSYAGWLARAGPEYRNGGSPAPVRGAIADRFEFVTGVDPDADPREHAETVYEVVEWVDRIERSSSGVGVDRTPLPTLTLDVPPGSLPDVRFAYVCPACSKLELLRTRFDEATGFRHFETLGCRAELYAPIPDRTLAIEAAALRGGGSAS